MMNALTSRGEMLAVGAVRRKVQEIAERLQDALPNVSVEAMGGSVTVSGRGVLKRWLLDPGLRFLWSALK